jgi:hypothetical protein
MKFSFTVALSGMALLLGGQTIRTPIQLENLRREAIETRSAKLADVNAGLTARIEAPAKRSSTISFANPAAQGMRSLSNCNK